jgi:UDP-N-acetylmuramate dehydrogenase
MHVAKNILIAQYTSLKVGGPVERLIALEQGELLQGIISDAQKNGPVWVLGYGTNCLISDKGLPGTVILDQTGSLERLTTNRFKAESGLSWDELVQTAIANNLWGIEFASGIPGGVGAAITGNIAAYGHKVADVLVEATILDPKSGSTEVWRGNQFGFDYRSSSLQLPENQHLIVLNATFEFSDAPTGELEYHSALKTAQDLGLKPDSLENRRKIILETRRRAGSLLTTVQAGPWTAGSFFKNPVVDENQIQAIISHEEASITPQQLLRQNQLHSGTKARVSAAHVLLAAGFHRGQTWGNVRLHPDHILKVENMGNASAREMYDVVQHILATVKQKLDIDLQPEVRFLGELS